MQQLLSALAHARGIVRGPDVVRIGNVELECFDP